MLSYLKSLFSARSHLELIQSELKKSQTELLLAEAKREEADAYVAVLKVRVARLKGEAKKNGDSA